MYGQTSPGLRRRAVRVQEKTGRGSAERRGAVSFFAELANISARVADSRARARSRTARTMGPHALIRTECAFGHTAAPRWQSYPRVVSRFPGEPGSGEAIVGPPLTGAAKRKVRSPCIHLGVPGCVAPPRVVRFMQTCPATSGLGGAVAGTGPEATPKGRRGRRLPGVRAHEYPGRTRAHAGESTHRSVRVEHRTRPRTWRR